MTIDDSAGRGGLRDHLPPHKAPAGLRDRVRGTLASRSARDGSRVRRWGGMAAAAVLLFVAGVGTGRATQTSDRQPQTPRYALLLYGGRETPNEVAGARAQEYGRWAANLTGARFVSGEELGPVIGAYGPPVSPTDTARVEGFFLIDAPSDTAAVAVARDCPHLKYGGRVVLQKLGDN